MYSSMSPFLIYILTLTNICNRYFNITVMPPVQYIRPNYSRSEINNTFLLYQTSTIYLGITINTFVMDSHIQNMTNTASTDSIM